MGASIVQPIEFDRMRVLIAKLNLYFEMLPDPRFKDLSIARGQYNGIFGCQCHVLFHKDKDWRVRVCGNVKMLYEFMVRSMVSHDDRLKNIFPPNALSRHARKGIWIKYGIFHYTVRWMA